MDRNELDRLRDAEDTAEWNRQNANPNAERHKATAEAIATAGRTACKCTQQLVEACQVAYPNDDAISELVTKMEDIECEISSLVGKYERGEFY